MAKIIFISQKYLVCDYSKWQQIKQSVQGLPFFVVAKKCKPCEIYRGICNVHGAACFNQENIYKWVLLLRAWVEKTVSRTKTHWISGKELVPAQRSVKKVMLTVVWDMKGPIITDFFEKGQLLTILLNADSHSPYNPQKKCSFFTYMCILHRDNLSVIKWYVFFYTGTKIPFKSWHK